MRNFSENADRQRAVVATEPALEAEALLGAGRAGLSREDLAGAKTHFLAAAELAETRYNEALALASHPFITANLVRVLVEAGRMDEAKQLHSRHSASYWTPDHRDELSQLLE